MNTLLISVISNIILEPYFSVSIAKVFSENQITVIHIPFAEYNTQKNSDVIARSDFIVVCPNFIDWFGSIERVEDDSELGSKIIENAVDLSKNLYAHLADLTNAPIIWFSFEDYECQYRTLQGMIPRYDYLVDRINIALSDILVNVCYVDLKQLIASVGISKTYNILLKSRWNAPYSKEFIIALCREIKKQYDVAQARTKKCLILDCDNVLWGDILSEVGAVGIELGAFGRGLRYKLFQKYVDYMFSHGVILAVCSRNEKNDVLAVFRNHSEMIINESQIAVFDVSWDNKVEGILRIAEKLNISLNSMVFVDDSVFEIEAVRAALPDVTCVLFELDTIYENLGKYFNLLRSGNRENNKLRTHTYQTDVLRQQQRLRLSNHEEYIESLHIQTRITVARENETARISELSLRANKWTNGIRYSRSELASLMGNDLFHLYSVYVSDIFGDLGLVGAIGFWEGRLDLIVLSCRALGRNIEQQLIDFVMNNQINHSRFQNTGINQEVKQTLMDAGINILND